MKMQLDDFFFLHRTWFFDMLNIFHPSSMYDQYLSSLPTEIKQQFCDILCQPQSTNFLFADFESILQCCYNSILSAYYDSMNVLGF